MRRIRIAQIGLNRYSHGPELFFTMRQHPEIFDLVGYALVEDERETCADKIDYFMGDAKELTLEEILEDGSIEAVAVETDEIHLFKYAQMAVEHGKHVHMEKPGSQSLADFLRLTETVERMGTVFHIGYMFRYNPVISAAVERVKRGELGRIRSVEAHMSRYDSRAGREWLSCFRGGMMFYLGSNMLDVILRIMGAPLCVHPMNRASGIGGTESTDLGFAVLEYPEGISFVRTDSVEVGGGNRRQIVILGERGTVEIRPIEKEYPTPTWQCMYTSESTSCVLDENGRAVKEKTVSEPFQRYFDMISSFAAMVRGEKENTYTLAYERMLYQTILQACDWDGE